MLLETFVVVSCCERDQRRRAVVLELALAMEKQWRKQRRGKQEETTRRSNKAIC